METRVATTNHANYATEFDVGTYLGGYYAPGKTKTIHEFSIQNLHEHFQSLPTETEFRVLDYGCGPVIANIISAARVASEIVLAEYRTRTNCSTFMAGQQPKFLQLVSIPQACRADTRRRQCRGS